MEQDQILDIAIRSGSILLKCGAETYRVEDTISRICKSYGLTCEAFVLPTGVFVSVEGQKGISTICKRIPSRTVDLTMISKVNDLSRRIEKSKPAYDEVIGELDRITQCEKYSNITIILCFAFTAFVYALLFGGSQYDALCALAVGIVLGFIRLVFSKGSSFPFIEYFVGGFAAGFLGSIAASLVPHSNAYVVTIGAVTNMLPGVALTNGIRDLLHGDSVSGLTRLGEALMVVAVIAAGTGIGLSIWFLGGSIQW
ncbi:MAG: threonine/serine exporter family protein [Clostridia bacterium]|nr:threonine/serine exporter family protein [Clostridia bacterium]